MRPTWEFRGSSLWEGGGKGVLQTYANLKLASYICSEIWAHLNWGYLLLWTFQILRYNPQNKISSMNNHQQKHFFLKQHLIWSFPIPVFNWGPHHWSHWTEEVDGRGNSDASRWLILVSKGERTMPRFSDSTAFRDLGTSRWVLGRWRCGTMGSGSYGEVFALSWTHTRKFILLLWTTESSLSWWYSFSRKCGQNQLGWYSFIARDIWFQSDYWKYQDKALDLRWWCHGSFWAWPWDHHCLGKETQSLCQVTSGPFENALETADAGRKKKAGWNDSRQINGW